MIVCSVCSSPHSPIELGKCSCKIFPEKDLKELIQRIKLLQEKINSILCNKEDDESTQI